MTSNVGTKRARLFADLCKPRKRQLWRRHIMQLATIFGLEAIHSVHRIIVHVRLHTPGGVRTLRIEVAEAAPSSEVAGQWGLWIFEADALFESTSHAVGVTRRREEQHVIDVDGNRRLRLGVHVNTAGDFD